MDDDELLARSARDPEAFGAFYERHERLVLGFFVRRVGEPELAADLAAETFAAALVAARRYRGDGAPATAWLVGIARNILFSSVRRERVEDRARRRLGMEPIVLDDELLTRIERLGGDGRVEALLARLTPEQSDAVRARVLDEQDYPGIAARLRCSESVVPQRVSRGLAVLRRGVPSLCLATFGGGASTAGCGPVADAVQEGKPPGISRGDISVLFLADGTTDARFIFADGSRGVAGVRNNTMLLRSVTPYAGASWTGASGTRYVSLNEFSPARARAPESCPAWLDPLPGDALARARRAALIAVDLYYANVREATAAAAGRPARTPCSAAITRNTVEVSLRLIGPKRRASQGRLLLGMVDGRMQV